MSRCLCVWGGMSRCLSRGCMSRCLCVYVGAGHAACLEVYVTLPVRGGGEGHITLPV